MQCAFLSYGCEASAVSSRYRTKYRPVLIPSETTQYRPVLEPPIVRLLVARALCTSCMLQNHQPRYHRIALTSQVVDVG